MGELLNESRCHLGTHLTLGSFDPQESVVKNNKLMQ